MANSYLIWNKQTISDFSDTNINSLYNEGFLFTRIALGDIYQTRSLRIDLNKFKLTSENKRILKKTENLSLTSYELPVTNYDWRIGKLGKDFYSTKFGDGTFSANKIKELLTTKHNFNELFQYVFPSLDKEGRTRSVGAVESDSTPPRLPLSKGRNQIVGYAICFENKEILHYCYPFYDLKPETYKLIPNIGMGMMLRTIVYTKEQGKKYVYLGSVKDEAGKYKLQFEGLEWFDGKTWKTDLEELKQQIKQNTL